MTCQAFSSHDACLVRPLISTLTVAELSKLLGVSPGVVEALIEDGALLCQVKEGEARVPLAQVEAFLRDSLMKVYRAESQGVIEAPAAEERAPTPPTDEVPSPASEPAAPLVRMAAIVPAEQPDLRRMPRYVPRRQIDGIFEDLKFTIVQISRTGLRIRHKESLVPGTEGKLSFALLKPARSVVLRTRVVWTSLARSGEERFSISGMRVLEHSERLEQAVEMLLAGHDLQPDRRIQSRREADATTVVASASDEEIALITNAMQRFAIDPVEASRWYSRGRFALSDEQVRRLAPPKASDREEVLGIWEYLERQVDLEKVASVVAWTRGAN